MFFFFTSQLCFHFFILFFFFQASDPSVCLFDRRAPRFKVWWIFKFKKFICAFLSWTLCMLIRTAGWTGHSPYPRLYFSRFSGKTADYGAAHFKARPALTLCTQRSHLFSSIFFRFLFINIIWYMHVFICFEATKCGKAAGAEGKQIKIAHIKRNFLFVLSEASGALLNLGCFY